MLRILIRNTTPFEPNKGYNPKNLNINNYITLNTLNLKISFYNILDKQ